MVHSTLQSQQSTESLYKLCLYRYSLWLSTSRAPREHLFGRTHQRMTTTKVTTTIIVFKPHEEAEDQEVRRHVALLFRFEDGSPNTLYRIKGSLFKWDFERREKYYPSLSRGIVKESIGFELLKRTNDEEIHAALVGVKVDNESEDVTCQVWLGDALDKLAEGGFVTDQDADKAKKVLADLVLDKNEDTAANDEQTSP